MLNGVREGYGKQKWPDGSEYDGYWKAGHFSGLGKLKRTHGDLYEGNWIAGKA